MSKIVLCGSGKRRTEIRALASALWLKSVFVLEPPLHQIEALCEGRPEELRQLAWKGATFAHFNRIDKADIVLIVNPDGYIGPSTTLELGYAVARQKLIVAMCADSAEPARNVLFDVVLETSDIDSVCSMLMDLLGEI